MAPAPRHWQELSWTDFADLDPERTVAVLPVGAMEQHGPHLPVMVDACVAGALVERMLEMAPADLPVLALPTVWAGKSDEHLDYPGTITHSAETLTRMWTEIGASVARAGVRKLLILNSHGGQIQVSQIVARALRIEHRMMVSSVIWPQLGLPEGLFGEDELRFGIHAGDLETSVMLALRPDRVRMDRAGNFVPATLRARETAPILAGLGAAGFGWQAQDLHPKGACGDATLASVEKGRAVLEHVAGRLVALVDELSRWPLASLADGPLRRAAEGGCAAG
ncbi:creatininase family protein [Geminicoccaceae bacterium 1502E]|nr:creatininase family protein [Geminicoccaceae bacterium 1502E]